MTIHAMDSGRTVISSKTNDGRKGQYDPVFRRSSGPSRFKAPQCIVEIRCGGKAVGEMDLITLSRFSSLAAELFPKPAPAAQKSVIPPTSGVTSTAIATASLAPATVTADQTSKQQVITSSVPTKTVEGSCTKPKPNTAPILKFPVQIQKLFQRPKPKPAATPQAVESPMVVVPERKTLVLDPYCVYNAPSEQAIKFVLDWMRKARRSRRNETPPTCAVARSPLKDSRPDEVQKYDPFLCELYAAITVFGIRPTAGQARKDLMANITTALPTLHMVQHIHGLVATEDGVMTRLINAYFDRVSADPYLPDREEVALIHKYVDESDDDDLYNRFQREQRHRQFQARKQRRQALKGGEGSQGAQGSQGWLTVQHAKGALDNREGRTKQAKGLNK